MYKETEFDRVLDSVCALGLKDQKDLAENILERLEENNYEVTWHGSGSGLEAVKTEHL